MAPILKSLEEVRPDCIGLDTLVTLRVGDKIKVFCQHGCCLSFASAEIRQVDPHLYAELLVKEQGVRYEHVGCLAHLHIKKQDRRHSAPGRLEGAGAGAGTGAGSGSGSRSGSRSGAGTQTYYREFVPRKRSRNLTERDFWDKDNEVDSTASGIELTELDLGDQLNDVDSSRGGGSGGSGGGVGDEDGSGGVCVGGDGDGGDGGGGGNDAISCGGGDSGDGEDRGGSGGGGGGNSVSGDVDVDVGDTIDVAEVKRQLVKGSSLNSGVPLDMSIVTAPAHHLNSTWNSFTQQQHQRDAPVLRMQAQWLCPDLAQKR